MKLLFVFFIAFLSSITGLVYAQNNVTVSNPKREIRFIDLDAEENETYRKASQTITQLIMDAIRQGKVPVWSLNYTSGFTAQAITLDQYKKLLKYTSPNDIGRNTDKLDYTSFTILGLDQTVGTAGGKEYAQVHYVNFYHYDMMNERVLDDPYVYMFSVRWSDFIKILDERQDVLYTTNSHGSWWRGNVFLRNDRFGYGSEFIKLAQSGAGLRLEPFGKKGQRYELPKMEIENLSIYLAGRPEQGFFDNLEPVIAWNKDPYNSDSTDFISFSWKDFLSIAKDSAWQNLSEVYLLSEAFRLQKFSYTQDKMLYFFGDRVVSKDGLYTTGKNKDPLCSTQLQPSFVLKAPRKNFEKFRLEQYEYLSLEDTLNFMFQSTGLSLAGIIWENLYNGKLTAYESNALGKKLTAQEFVTKTSVPDRNQYEPLIMNIPTIDDFNKGDTIEVSMKKNIYGTSYFILKRNVKFNETIPESILPSVMTPYFFKPKRYTVAQLSKTEGFSLRYTTRFNKEGLKKTYELKAISVAVPAYLDEIRQVPTPVCSVSWEELRKILLTDPRAEIMYRDKKVNFVELMETREFFTLFYSTGFLFSEE